MASTSPTVHAAVPTGSWWTQIAPVVLGLGAFSVYATWRAFEGAYFWASPYLSPFYSPLLDVHHHYWPYSPALLILGGPLGFRATCYYYRKAYYRAFFLDPPACAVAERKRNYCGETRFPFILQNVHRYFMYLAIVFLVFLWHDALHAFVFADRFGVGLGTLVLLVNVMLLTLYFSSCHSLRHLLGGKLDCFSCTNFGNARHSTWRGLSFLNEHHMLFAWTSLFSVGLADFYVRLVSSGAIRDLRLL
ncbi:MAG: succinate dehydrogenase [Acidobacteria bacterium]|nr:succinate dehydrogenase [Acidobacteriota bacterium]MBV9625694.1 succinate dehydrogenase [Acidobacteriota bacterium]